MKMPFPLNVPQLLTVLAGLGAITLGIVAFDAERLIGAVDDLKGVQAADHTQITVNAADIASIKPQIGDLQIKVVDLQGRVIKLEPR